MLLNAEQKKQLKSNCLAIKEFLIDLVKPSETDISLSAKFGRCGIAVYKRTSFQTKEPYYDVCGFIGGLGIKFEDMEERSCYSDTAWNYTSYGIELIANWPIIKQEMLNQLANEIATKQSIMSFHL